MSEKDTGGPAFPRAGSQYTNAESGMTLRQYAAIKLKVPDSGTDWLDEMILASQRNELAATAMQGLVSQMSSARQLNSITEAAHEIADSMLEAIK
jgi:hypothetical protein